MFRFIIISVLIYTILFVLARKAPWAIRWIGDLPGDLRVKQEKNILYLPFSSMLLISLSIALVITLIKHFL